jgi:hypothetical protein
MEHGMTDAIPEDRQLRVVAIKKVNEDGRFVVAAWIPAFDLLLPDLVLAANNPEEAEVEAGYYLQILCERLAETAGLDPQKDVLYE